jgi:serine/threonine protein kinase
MECARTERAAPPTRVGIDEEAQTSCAAGSRGVPVPPRIPGLAMVRHLASGGEGEVWMAHDEVGLLAAKVVHGDRTGVDWSILGAYRAAASQSGSGLYPVQLVGRTFGGRLFAVMPLADPLDDRAGGTDDYQPCTLAGYVKAQGFLTAEECLDLGLRILGAIGVLHRRGLLHRDVKPANILRHQGEWYLADPGLLCREDDPALEHLAGTPRYIPPERGPADRGGDLYALGRTLLDCLPERMQGEDLRLAVRLRAVLLGATAARPGRRYGSVGEMEEALLRVARRGTCPGIPLAGRCLPSPRPGQELVSACGAARLAAEIVTRPLPPGPEAHDGVARRARPEALGEAFRPRAHDDR